MDVVAALRRAAKESPFVRSVQQAKAAWGRRGISAAHDGAKAKPLTAAQITQLKRQGNCAESWKTVWAAKGFDPTRVWHSTFYGTVVLGAFRQPVALEPSLTFSSGISRSRLEDCHVGDHALIRDSHVARTVVKSGAAIVNVGILASGPKTAFGNGTEIPIAIETGGRDIALYAELTVDGAWVLSRSRANKALLAQYADGLEAYRQLVTADFGIVEGGAVIRNTPTVVNVYVGERAVIDGAQLVQQATILSSAEEATEITSGAIVKSSLLQWGSEVASHGLVDSSLLTEHSHVERHGLVTGSILGPNTGVAEGEVTASLLGPFVGFHHQALLIAALWPEGKGNVGYGANVGSNHTAKAPDQEIWPGEGAFFGLGVNIKFPADYSKSPYTIFASGVNCLPQRMAFPFSLVNGPAVRLEGISPAYNEIIPAWVLSDNIYMVTRNEGKYQKRNKARRSQFVFEVFRPEIADLMVDARRRLQGVKAPKEVYTAKEIEGLGKNYLTESSRVKAIETYTFYLKYYALLGLKREVAELIKEKGALATLLTAPCAECPRWEHERQTLRRELPDLDVAQGLTLLVELQTKIAKDVQVSKEKDDRRGEETIEDYAEAHAPAKEDGFVKETWAKTQQLQREVETLLAALPKRAPATEKAGKPASAAR
ncbi:MAG: DUF4954 family protein [Candidatus Omnitrophica bacterium]|nr:DUF4954 family protein [Candidatus Omnitrophota bacterium]